MESLIRKTKKLNKDLFYLNHLMRESDETFTHKKNLEKDDH